MGSFWQLLDPRYWFAAQRRRTAPSRKRISEVTIVAIRHDDWQITSFQNTRYRPWNRTTLGRLMTVISSRRFRDAKAA